jgi:hypothetical protein
VDDYLAAGAGRRDFRADFGSHAVAVNIPPGFEMTQDALLFAKAKRVPDIVRHRAHGIDHGAPIDILVRSLTRVAPDFVQQAARAYCARWGKRFG